MADQNFHEIQLSGKQLIFLFMCAVVLTVVVFLFGVSVGRQVPATVADVAEASAPLAADASQPPPAAAPAAPAANEVSYADAMAAAEDPTKAAPPPVSDEPTTEVQTQAPPPPAQKSGPAPAKAASKAAAKTAPAAASGGTSGWFVQVGAYNQNDVADREVTKLKGRGYPATVLTEAPTVPGPRFKVAVGPYERAEADRVRVQLTREGYPSFLRR